ncbi:hypothetical protein J4450_02165 [Candidatus Micrarchaeota archaeon]|nr:hypothetical protein [Candidatus Micrarchaeota archaeon]
MKLNYASVNTGKSTRNERRSKFASAAVLVAGLGLLNACASAQIVGKGKENIKAEATDAKPKPKTRSPELPDYVSDNGSCIVDKKIIGGNPEVWGHIYGPDGKMEIYRIAACDVDGDGSVDRIDRTDFEIANMLTISIKDGVVTGAEFILHPAETIKVSRDVVPQCERTSLYNYKVNPSEYDFACDLKGDFLAALQHISDAFVKYFKAKAETKI